MGNATGSHHTRKIAGVNRVRPFESRSERKAPQTVARIGRSRSSSFTGAVPSVSSPGTGSSSGASCAWHSEETGLPPNAGGALLMGAVDSDSRGPSEAREDSSRHSTSKVQSSSNDHHQQHNNNHRGSGGSGGGGGFVVIVDGETKKMPRSNTHDLSLRASLRVSIVSNISAGLLTRASSGSAFSIPRLAAPQRGAAPPPKVPFPKRPMGCKLSSHCWDRLEHLFRLLDHDGSNAVTKEEAKGFFSGAFSNLSVDAMFNEVDSDGDGTITAEEFVKFWVQVRGSGYKESDILDELGELIEGGAWVDWKDGRETTTAKSAKFPRRPFMSRMSPELWKRCEELFLAMRGSSADLWITRENAQRFYKGSFSLISAEEMFQTMDHSGHGVIRPKDFMSFWTQVKAHGHTDRELLAEINDLMKGGPWVNWQNR